MLRREGEARTSDSVRGRGQCGARRGATGNSDATDGIDKSPERINGRLTLSRPEAHAAPNLLPLAPHPIASYFSLLLTLFPPSSLPSLPSLPADVLL